MKVTATCQYRPGEKMGLVGCKVSSKEEAVEGKESLKSEEGEVL